jgi:hypothetical protein
MSVQQGDDASDKDDRGGRKKIIAYKICTRAAIFPYSSDGGSLSPPQPFLEKSVMSARHHPQWQPISTDRIVHFSVFDFSRRIE